MGASSLKVNIPILFDLLVHLHSSLCTSSVSSSFKEFSVFVFLYLNPSSMPLFYFSFSPAGFSLRAFSPCVFTFPIAPSPTSLTPCFHFCFYPFFIYSVLLFHGFLSSFLGSFGFQFVFLLLFLSFSGFLLFLLPFSQLKHMVFLPGIPVFPLLCMHNICHVSFQSG